jgi:hypothetical protein
MYMRRLLHHEVNGVCYIPRFCQWAEVLLEAVDLCIIVASSILKATDHDTWLYQEKEFRK